MEPSFSSKLLATVNPDKPIWDGRVLTCLSLKQRWDRDKSIENAVTLYNEICDWYSFYLNTDDERKSIRVFNRYLPEYKDKITDVKKMDYLLWGNTKLN